jgi:hypothetical protein
MCCCTSFAKVVREYQLHLNDYDLYRCCVGVIRGYCVSLVEIYIDDLLSRTTNINFLYIVAFQHKDISFT